MQPERQLVQRSIILASAGRRAVSPDERKQAPAHAARILVIALKAHAQRLFLDADPDAEPERLQNQKQKNI